MARRLRREAPATEDLIDQIRARERPLAGPDDLDPLLDRIGEARLVLLGEASHGTAEYYNWRAVLSRRLILEKGFSFLAVEGDWPACDLVDRFVKGFEDAGADAREALQAFDRWPTWMWANEEVAELADWLRGHNRSRPEADRVGFYGLDVYSLWDSLYAVLGYLRRVDPQALDAARRAFRCFEPYGEDVQEYARATTGLVPESCEDEVVELLAQMRRKAPAYREDSREAAFRAEQNALVVKDAEAYYRAMIRGSAESWNIRDRHMTETLERLLRHHGPGTRAIVWEHNTHIGDARFTDMAEDGMVNVGQ
jgi:erythromycin esterase-like protein